MYPRICSARGKQLNRGAHHSFNFIFDDALDCDPVNLALPSMIAASVRYLPVHHRVAFYFIVFIVSQAYMNSSMIAYMTYTLNLAPDKSRPTYLGFLNTLMFPMSFVPVLAGALLKIMTYESMFILSAGVSALAIYFGIKLTNVENRGSVDDPE